MSKQSKNPIADQFMAAFLEQTHFASDESMRSDDGSNVSKPLQAVARQRRNMIVVPLTDGSATSRSQPEPPSGAETASVNGALPFEYVEEGGFDVGLTARHSVETPGGAVDVEGSCLVCLCPDCNAPMSVRIWLELADCWRCMTSIQLDQEQLNRARQLAGIVEPAIAESIPDDQPVPQPAPAAPVPQAAPAAPMPVPASRQPDYSELERLTEGSVLARLVRRGFQLTPAWVVSFLLHLVAILIMALIVLGGSLEDVPMITLSTTITSDEQVGGDIRIENPLHLLQDDLPLAGEMPENEREIRDVIERAEAAANELLVDPQPTAPQQDLDVLRRNLTTAPGESMNFLARDPRVRSEIVTREGGTLMTEAAVARGLRWLASVQNRDGSWSLNDYRNHRDPDNEGDALATSLALLPFLGAGQTHEFGVYKETVARGLNWMLRNQRDNGDLRAGYTRNAGMYAHGQATIVLCETLAMTGDEQFREPAQMAINFIEQAQHRQGGWRYQPGDEGDTSVAGWQIMALQSARAPEVGLRVDNATLSLADYFLDKVSSSRQLQRASGGANTRIVGSLYGYQPGEPPTAAMTAEALLCRMYLGWDRSDPRLRAGIDWLMEKHLPERGERMNIYYWYYGSQLMHHYGGEDWERWNSRIKQLLLSTQETRGRYPGSWDPDPFRWGEGGGRIYTTALCVCTLEVYYRHLPLFRKLDLERR
ncbi:MAG: prenyltransferase/squalene oxidase repeat-containing protein [Planctomycetota bacterium]